MVWLLTLASSLSKGQCCWPSRTPKALSCGRRLCGLESPLIAKSKSTCKKETVLNGRESALMTARSGPDGRCLLNHKAWVAHLQEDGAQRRRLRTLALSCLSIRRFAFSVRPPPYWITCLYPKWHALKSRSFLPSTALQILCQSTRNCFGLIRLRVRRGKV